MGWENERKISRKVVTSWKKQRGKFQELFVHLRGKMKGNLHGKIKGFFFFTISSSQARKTYISLSFSISLSTYISYVVTTYICILLWD